MRNRRQSVKTYTERPVRGTETLYTARGSVRFNPMTGRLCMVEVDNTASKCEQTRSWQETATELLSSPRYTYRCGSCTNKSSYVDQKGRCMDRHVASCVHA